ncbi:hypothetical protein QYF96_18735, partial [Xanthomonas euvesicatoria]|uniref:hypothetical protein n=1 Tax=Xanthomonas euvesicatoria TaxID=456327 RepID=UPI0032B4EEFB
SYVVWHNYVFVFVGCGICGGAAACVGRHVLDCAAFKAIISTLPGAVPRHCGTVGGINVAIDSRDG